MKSKLLLLLVCSLLFLVTANAQKNNHAQAEADIRANSLATALPILNASRSRGNQPDFTGTTQADYVAELIDQRRRELFLESHHLGDVIRYGITLTPAVGSTYQFGGTYGNQICFPLPAAERLNNPLIGS